MDRIDLFKVFVRVVELASFTRAADALALPRSSVSAAVRDLESRVGARLLHRTTRKVAPTPDGTAFYERCLRLLAEVEETEALFRQSARRPGGKLKVDVPGRLGRRIIAPALPDFFARYPDIELDFGVTDRAVNLVEQGVDGVLRVGVLSESGLIARTFGVLPLINAAAPSYLERYGIPRTPDDLEAHLAVKYASPSSGRIEDWEWVENEQIRTRAVRGRITVNSAEAYIACALAGLGMIQIPAYDVKTHLGAGELVEILPCHRAQPLPLTFLYPSRRHLSRRVQVFADWLENLIRDRVLG